MKSVMGGTTSLATLILASLTVASCAGGGNAGSGASALPAAPSVSSIRLPTFAVKAVKIREVSIPTGAQYLAEGPDGAVYFGNQNECSGLYRYLNGSVIVTAPATNSQYPASICGGGNGAVRAVGVAPDNTVAWAPFYPTHDDFGFGSVLNCGGNGGQATFCDNFQGFFHPSIDQIILGLYPRSRSQIFGAVDLWIGFYSSSASYGFPFPTGVVETTAQHFYGFANLTKHAVYIQIVPGSNRTFWVLSEACPQLPPPFNQPQCGLPYTLLNVNAQGSTEKSYPFPNKDYIGGIAFGRDDNIWFTDLSKNTIGRVTPSGTMTFHTLPAGSSLYAQAFTGAGIVSAPDGGIWFTDPGANKIGRIAMDGKIREFPIPMSSASPGEIVAPPGASCAQETIWFSEANNQLGEVTFE